MKVRKTSQSKRTGYKTVSEYPNESMSKATQRMNELVKDRQEKNPSSTIQRKGDYWVQVSTKNIWITYEVWGEFNVRDN